MKVKTLIRVSSISKFKIRTAGKTYIVDYCGKLNKEKGLYRTWVDLPTEISEAKVDLFTIWDESTLEIYL